MPICPKIKKIPRGKSLSLGNNNDLLRGLNRITVNTDAATGSMDFMILACIGFGQGSQECIKIYREANPTKKLCNNASPDFAQIYYKENTRKVLFEHNFILFVNYRDIDDISRIINILSNSINWLSLNVGKICFHIVVYGNPPHHGTRIILPAKYNSHFNDHFSSTGFNITCMFHYVNTEFSNTLAFSSSNPANLEL
jgi:hypothetical protein